MERLGRHLHPRPHHQRLGPANGNGTYGRFRYVPSLNVFVVVSGVDENVFVYRLDNVAPALVRRLEVVGAEGIDAPALDVPLADAEVTLAFGVVRTGSVVANVVDAAAERPPTGGGAPIGERAAACVVPEDAGAHVVGAVRTGSGALLREVGVGLPAVGVD